MATSVVGEYMQMERKTEEKEKKENIGNIETNIKVMKILYMHLYLNVKVKCLSLWW